MPDIETKRFIGDLDAYILQKRFTGDITSVTSEAYHNKPGISNSVASIFAGKIAGVASKDRYLLKCIVTISSNTGTLPWGVVKLCRQTTLTGQTAFTVNQVTTSNIVTTSSAHSYTDGDIVKFSGVTTCTPQLINDSHMVVDSPSGSTFTLRGQVNTTVQTTGAGGTCTRVYQKSNEVLLEEHIIAINVGSSGGQGGNETHTIEMTNAIGNKITNGQEFMVYIDEGNRGSNAGSLFISTTFVCVDVPTGADPTVL